MRVSEEKWRRELRLHWDKTPRKRLTPSDGETVSLTDVDAAESVLHSTTPSPGRTLFKSCTPRWPRMNAGDSLNGLQETCIKRGQSSSASSSWSSSSENESIWKLLKAATGCCLLRSLNGNPTPFIPKQKFVICKALCKQLCWLFCALSSKCSWQTESFYSFRLPVAPHSICFILRGVRKQLSRLFVVQSSAALSRLPLFGSQNNRFIIVVIRPGKR